MPRFIASIPSLFAAACALSLVSAAHAEAAITVVPADSSMQAALDAAQPGDATTLEPLHVRVFL
jgi:hypothetical protein